MTRSLCTKGHQGFRFCLTPKLQRVKVFGCNFAFAQFFKQVVTKSGWEVRPLNFRHSCHERLARQFLLEVLPLTSAGSSNQAFGKFKKAALFVFLGFESSLDQLFQYLIGASAFAFRKDLDLAIDLSPQRNAATHKLLCALSGSHMFHFTPRCTTSHHDSSSSCSSDIGVREIGRAVDASVLFAKRATSPGLPSQAAGHQQRKRFCRFRPLEKGTGFSSM